VRYKVVILGSQETRPNQIILHIFEKSSKKNPLVIERLAASGNPDFKFPENCAKIGLIQQEKRSIEITDPVVLERDCIIARVSIN
jgi:hypothetical protein